ncbi:MAG: glycosyltransferase family 2 protein [Actinobacteria bacterium]|nr:glycosyltransferase family 2 protein [Actinomycetota bacterium]
MGGGRRPGHAGLGGRAGGRRLAPPGGPVARPPSRGRCVTGPGPSVDVVLPVLDEEQAVPWVLERMPPGYRAIVVDNGSTDRSAELAAVAGATVVEEPVKGFGAACWRGLVTATADVVCFMDCDGSLDPSELPALVDDVVADRVDLAIGRRRPEKGAWPPHARAANVALARMVRRRTGVDLPDLGPMRVTRRADLLLLGLTDRRSGWPVEMVLRASAAGWRIGSYDVPYLRRSGASKVTGTVGGTIRAVADMRRRIKEFDDTIAAEPARRGRTTDGT